MVWRPSLEPTVGVQFLPGFKNGTPRIVREPRMTTAEALGMLQTAAAIPFDDGRILNPGVRRELRDEILKLAERYGLAEVEQ